jgi:hypothetical protein
MDNISAEMLSNLGIFHNYNRPSYGSQQRATEFDPCAWPQNGFTNESWPANPQKKRKLAFKAVNNMVIIVKMDGAMAKPELIASAAQDQQSWNLYTEQGEFFDQDPPSWQNLSRAEEILIKRRDWRARKRLLAYTSRRLRQERLTANGASNLEKAFISSGHMG